jgi:serine/tyrosine/threonine adenylyltransferase
MMPEPITFDNSYYRLPGSFYSNQNPTPVSSPSVIAVNQPLAKEIGIDQAFLCSDEGLKMLSGNTIVEGSQPIATVYAGYQFGHWNPQLGDGRAILLGEIINNTGKRFDLQLKGSGPTLYSRGGDGRAPLGPVLREYLVSEAMHNLGIPTTRGLAAVFTGDHVQRESPEPGAILTRVASSHIRFGTFQYFAAKGDIEALTILADHVISRHYPEALESANPYVELLNEVMKKIARLVSKWQALGFIHGVMNTDNMLVCGETVDYGPCAFMDEFNPGKVFSSIDSAGRYGYQNQPGIAQWNLMTFAQALLPLLADSEEQAVKQAQIVLEKFPEVYAGQYDSLMARKIGLSPENPAASGLIASLLELLDNQKLDYTLSFRSLMETLREEKQLYNDDPAWMAWNQQWLKQFNGSTERANALSAMGNINPVCIPRNHILEEVISQTRQAGDLSSFNELLQALQDPYNPKWMNTIYAKGPDQDQLVLQTFCGT